MYVWDYTYTALVSNDVSSLVIRPAPCNKAGGAWRPQHRCRNNNNLPLVTVTWIRARTPMRMRVCVHNVVRLGKMPHRLWYIHVKTPAWLLSVSVLCVRWQAISRQFKYIRCFVQHHTHTHIYSRSSSTSVHVCFVKHYDVHYCDWFVDTVLLLRLRPVAYVYENNEMRGGGGSSTRDVDGWTTGAGGGWDCSDCELRPRRGQGVRCHIPRRVPGFAQNK